MKSLREIDDFLFTNYKKLDELINLKNKSRYNKGIKKFCECIETGIPNHLINLFNLPKTIELIKKLETLEHKDNGFTYYTDRKLKKFMGEDIGEKRFDIYNMLIINKNTNLNLIPRTEDEKSLDFKSLNYPMYLDVKCITSDFYDRISSIYVSQKDYTKYSIINKVFNKDIWVAIFDVATDGFNYVRIKELNEYLKPTYTKNIQDIIDTADFEQIWAITDNDTIGCGMRHMLKLSEINCTARKSSQWDAQIDLNCPLCYSEEQFIEKINTIYM